MAAAVSGRVHLSLMPLGALEERSALLILIVILIVIVLRHTAVAALAHKHLGGECILRRPGRVSCRTATGTVITLRESRGG